MDFYPPSEVYFIDGKYYLTHRDELCGYNFDGSRDQSFGVGGRVLVPNADNNNYDIDGSLVSNDAFYIFGSHVGGDSFIAKINFDGTFDNSFRTNGFALFNYNADNYFSKFVDITIIGNNIYGLITKSDQGIICKIGLNESLDENFGNEGIKISEMQCLEKYSIKITRS